MGQILTFFEPPPPHNEVVLVPPLFERDMKGRSRLAKSSYEFLFCKPNLRWLFNDYLPCGFKSLLHFSPPEDPRVSVTVRMRGGVDLAGRRVHVGSFDSGSATLRFQAQPTRPTDFLDVKVYTQGESARVRGCYYDPASGMGVFGTVPLIAGSDADAVPDARLGLRYSTSTTSFGIIVNPFSESVTQLWAVTRSGPLTAGAQVQPPPGFFHKGPQRMWQDVPLCSSFAFSYSPSGGPVGRGQFTAALEVQEQRRLVMSFLHHMAVQRLCKNPFEDAEVAGITNYLDFGLQIVSGLARGQRSAGAGSTMSSSSVAEPEPDLNSIRLGAAWQANKNLLLKARVGTDAVTASVAFKAWWQPSFTFALSGGYNMQKRKPQIGFVFNCENYGNIRYERGQRAAFGGALVQRHVALPQDLANKAGKGLLVQKADLDNAQVLGQTTTDASFVL